MIEVETVDVRVVKRPGSNAQGRSHNSRRRRRQGLIHDSCDVGTMLTVCSWTIELTMRASAMSDYEREKRPASTIHSVTGYLDGSVRLTTVRMQYSLNTEGRRPGWIGSLPEVDISLRYTPVCPSPYAAHSPSCFAMLPFLSTSSARASRSCVSKSFMFIVGTKSLKRKSALILSYPYGR